MEIAPVPHRSHTRGERYVLAAGVLVLAPVVLLVLLPAVLGLDRYVATDSAMGGTLDRGSVLLARDVPPRELAPGDVITVTAPSGDSRGERVTRRVVAVGDETFTTRGDELRGIDPWTLRLDREGYARVWASVPWIGYPFVVTDGWLLLVVAALTALGLAIVAARSHRAELARRAAVARPPRTRLPVAP